MRLADLLEQNRTEILEEWRRRVTGPMNPLHSPTPEIINSLPVFFDEMVEKMRQGRGADIQPSRTAPKHGALRFHAGFSLGNVIREYRAFQDCILDLIKQNNFQPSIDEVQAALNCLTTAIADAAQEFSKERDAAIVREKEQHLAFIAHEIRNPLSSVRLALDIMQRTLPLPQPPALARAHRNLSRMQDLIDNEIMNVRVGSLSSEFALRKERLDLDELVREIATDTAGDIEGKEIELVIQTSPSAAVDADRRLIYSALANLVRNAVKFTPARGKVLVQVHASEGRVSVEVEDQCGGLPHGKVEELFLPYIQKGRDRSGFGLGLAIAKQAIEAHGGSIQARNLPATGCVFMFDLPAAPYDP